MQYLTARLDNSSETSSSSRTAFNNLYPALIECFFVILLGYGAGRLGFVSRTSGKGIGFFLSHASLPALLLKSMIELDLSMVNWKFLAGILIAKGTVFVTVVFFSLLLLKPFSYGRAGIFAIFATQSNDFALGYPVLKAIYKDSHPEYVKYIYLLAPISLACLNPIGFFMMEYQRQRNAEGHTIHKLRLISKTLKGIIFDPVVSMTFIGIIFSYVFNHKLPSILHSILDNLGSAFSATALFYLGFQMVGSMKKNVGFALIIPFLLCFAKTLLVPLIAREVIAHLEVGKNNSDSWSMLGFLYGTFPSAPTVVVFAARYGFETETMATGLVLCTFLAAPIMFITAQMSQMNNNEDMNRELIQQTLFDTSCIAIPCAVWVFIVFILSRRFKEKPHNYTLCLLFCQFTLALSGVLSVVQDPSLLLQNIQLLLFIGSCYGSRCWTSLVALGLFLVRCNRKTTLQKWNASIHILGWGIPLLGYGLILFIGKLEPPANYESSISRLMGQKPVMGTSIVVQVVSLCTTVLFLVLLKHSDRYCKCPDSLKNSKHFFGADFITDSECNKDRCRRCQDLCKEIAERKSKSNSGINNESDPDACCAAVSSNKNSVLDIENLDESTCLLQKSQCSSLRHSYSEDSFEILASFETELESDYFYGEKHQLGRHVTLLLLLSVSTCLGIFLCIWRLSGEPNGGIQTALEVLDVILLFGQGFMAFACFGFEKNLIIIPFVKKIRRIIHGKEELWLPAEEDLDSDVVHRCDQFEQHHKQRCQRALLQKKIYRFGTSNNVFRGDQLVDWILEIGLASDRQTAVQYGKSLVLGRVIEHVAKQHHFYDLPYFYKFCK